MSLVETLAQIVKDAGYVVEVDGTRVPFKVEGMPYCFQTFAGDDGYARLVADFAIPADVSLERMLVVANALNRKAKAVKTVVDADTDDEGLTFSVELYFPDPLAWAAMFERSLASLRRASDEYYALLDCAEE